MKIQGNFESNSEIQTHCNLDTFSCLTYKQYGPYNSTYGGKEKFTLDKDYDMVPGELSLTDFNRSMDNSTLSIIGDSLYDTALIIHHQLTGEGNDRVNTETDDRLLNDFAK